LNQNVRLEFTAKDDNVRVNQQIPRPDETEPLDNISLNPMQIRTFVIRSGAFTTLPNTVNIIVLLCISLWKIFA